jgi:hypothetical protein
MLHGMNVWAILVSAVAIFMLGGLWYSPLLFAKRWVALMGKSEEELKKNAPGPIPFLLVFICAIVTSLAMAIILAHHSGPLDPAHAVCAAVVCWAGFAGATSFGTALFSGEKKALWLINTSYNLLSFIIAALILSSWR